MISPTKSSPQETWKRKMLRHVDPPGAPQHVIFRLAGALPPEAAQRFQEQCKGWPEREQNAKYRMLVDDYLDENSQGHLLANPQIAELVEDALLHFDEQRYYLYAWVIMPNHVHVVFATQGEHKIASIIHSWKVFTAKKANALLNRQGSFWQRDYFDRLIRHQHDFYKCVKYVENNPVKAGLCTEAIDWPFSSARLREGRSLTVGWPEIWIAIDDDYLE